MAYYVRIGRVPQNLTGVGARGWQAFRRGRTVCLRYGKVIVNGPRNSRVIWAGPHPRKITRTFRSIAAAKAFLQAAIAEKCAQRNYRGGAYQRLPAGQVIQRRRRPAD